MATPLQRRVISSPHLPRLVSTLLSPSRSLSTDALVELQPGEIGLVSGSPRNTSDEREPAVITREDNLSVENTRYLSLPFHRLLNDHLPMNLVVIIYSPARTATQQGSGKVGRWKINFMSTQKWENPLMGWTSTGDPYANVGDAALSFDSAEAAAAFAEKHGWDFVVKERHTPLLKPKAYSDNFKWKGPPKAAED